MASHLDAEQALEDRAMQLFAPPHLRPGGCGAAGDSRMKVMLK